MLSRFNNPALHIPPSAATSISTPTTKPSLQYLLLGHSIFLVLCQWKEVPGLARHDGKEHNNTSNQRHSGLTPESTSKHRSLSKRSASGRIPLEPGMILVIFNGLRRIPPLFSEPSSKRKKGRHRSPFFWIQTRNY